MIVCTLPRKRYSRFIELVKRQYRSAEHGLVRGIGVVNLVHSTGDASDFWPVDFRIYAPDSDGKTKNAHFRKMLVRAVTDKRLEAPTVLFDSWYAAADNLKLIQRLGLSFFTTLKENRRVSLSKEGGYIHLDKNRVAAPTAPTRRARETESSPFPSAVIQAGRHERRH